MGGAQDKQIGVLIEALIVYFLELIEIRTSRS